MQKNNRSLLSPTAVIAFGNHFLSQKYKLYAEAFTGLISFSFFNFFFFPKSQKTDRPLEVQFWHIFSNLDAKFTPNIMQICPKYNRKGTFSALLQKIDANKVP